LTLAAALSILATLRFPTSEDGGRARVMLTAIDHLVTLTVMTYNLVGDGLRDALDPHELAGGDMGRGAR
jgi:hypothetical protein